MANAILKSNAKTVEPAEWLRSPVSRALLGLIFLLVIAYLIAPNSLSGESVVAMAPFIGVLGVAAIGQHLVMQQRGFDLSVAANMSIAAAIVTFFPSTEASGLATTAFVIVALLAGTVTGLLNGLVINWLRVPALVTTIGVNATVMGFLLFLTNGAVYKAPNILVDLVGSKFGIVSALFLGFVLLSLFFAWAIERTLIGRRFVATAVSANAARALGVRIHIYSIFTYCIAGFLFSLAGVLLAGLAVTPTLLSGNPYMLSTVAAVIVGGMPLNGDRGSVIATLVGVVFLTVLNQVVVSLGFDFAFQSMVQAVIILIGVVVPQLLQQVRSRPSSADGKNARVAAAAGKAPLSTVATSSNASTDAAAQMAAIATPILELKNIRKTFGSTVALANVDFSAAKGEVHAIIGENGAGKSTLISVASGVLEATEGEVRIGGELVSGRDANAFREAGISVAFQHPPLPPHLTVLECMMISAPAFGQSGGAEKAKQIINRVTLGSLRVSPEDRISNLSIGQRHVVEIARALASNPQILVLDEPTEPFKDDDVAQLFALIRQLKDSGVAIVYISHRLNEVAQIADRISVLRDGELIASRPSAEFTREEIISMIVGRPLGQVFPDKLAEAGAGVAALEVRSLSGAGFQDVSFSAGRGEIIGLAGVEGQGQRNLMRALAGLQGWSGQIVLAGQELSYSDRPGARSSGIAFVSDDRHLEGLFTSLSVAENLNAATDSVRGKSVIVDRNAENEFVRSAVGDLNIRASSPQAAVASLSGGNQQKVLIGREMGTAPRLFLADEPTKGVDIGSKSDIYKKLRDLADAGIAVIVASSDGVELEGLCDRVLVMSGGTVASQLSGADVSDAEITAAILTASHGQTNKQDSAKRENPVQRLLSNKLFPPVVLGIVSLLIATSAFAVNSRFILAFNLTDIQSQLATLALIAFGQLFVMLLGEIDFSVGPLAGFVVVLASFWLPDGASGSTIIFAAIGIVLVTMLIGFIQGLAVVLLDIPSIVVTLASFFGLQGLSLLLRPLPGGVISSTLVDTMLFAVGPLSAATLVLILIAFGLERTLLRSSFGRFVRAVGSNRVSAQNLGIKRRTIVPITFAINGALVGLAGLLLAATNGIGSGTVGVNYSLMSITAVVLGGAIISGGYGSFYATLFGALFVQMTFSATTFMGVGVEWQYWVVGVTTLLAAALFSFSTKNDH